MKSCCQFTIDHGFRKSNILALILDCSPVFDDEFSIFVTRWARPELIKDSVRLRDDGQIIGNQWDVDKRAITCNLRCNRVDEDEE